MAQEIFHKKWLQNIGRYSLRLFPYKFIFNYKCIGKHHQEYEKDQEYLLEFLNLPYRLSNVKFLCDILLNDLRTYNDLTVENKIKKIKALSLITFNSGQGIHKTIQILHLTKQNFNFTQYYINEYYGNKNQTILSHTYRIIHSLGIQPDLLKQVKEKKDLELLIFVLNEYMLKQINDYSRKLSRNEEEIIFQISQNWKDNLKLNWILYKLNIDQDLF